MIKYLNFFSYIIKIIGLNLRKTPVLEYLYVLFYLLNIIILLYIIIIFLFLIVFNSFTNYDHHNCTC